MRINYSDDDYDDDDDDNVLIILITYIDVSITNTLHKCILFYSFLHFSALNLSLFDECSVFDNYYVHKWQSIHIHVSV
jgi:hypothetical protein